MSDLATRIVETLERLDSTSASVLRTATYAALEPFVDVGKLVNEARTAHIAALREKAEARNNSAARRRARVARIPELMATVHTGNPAPVREMLEDPAQKWKIDDIAAATGTTRRYVAAVRDLARARKDREWLRDNTRNRWEERLKRAEARKGYGDPTRERVRQAGAGEKVIEAKTVGEQKSHRFLWPVEQIRRYLSADEYAAAQAFRDAYEGLGGRAKVANWGGSGGGNPANKLAITPAQERAAREYQVFRKGLAKNPTARALAENFILGEKVRGHDRPLSFVEWGRRYASVEGEQQARGIAQGLLWLVCADLAAISREHAQYLAQEQRAVLRAVGQRKEIMDLIRTHRPHEAKEALCRLLPVKSWIVEKTVQKLYRAALREQQEAVEHNRQKESSAA